MKQIIIILVLLSAGLSGICQTAERSVFSKNECAARVSEAEVLYEKGQYDKCISLLESVIQACELTKQEKARAFELQAKAYLEIDEPLKAEAAVNLMLRNDPHYELNEADNYESYNRLIKKFKVHPRFSVGARNTAGWPKFNTTKVITFNENVDYSVSYYQNLEGILNDFGLLYYGWAELEFDRNISLNADLIFKWTKINRELTNPSAFDISYWEKDTYIETPVYIKKYFPVGKNLLPYVTVGLGWLYMTEATANASIYYTANDSTASTGDINVLDIRNRHNFEWIAGAGLGYKIKNLRLFVDVRYYGGLTSITNPEAGFNHPILANDYYYVDNYVKLNVFEIGVSVSYTFINSVKRVRY